MNTEKKGSEIFNISDNKSSVICPPEQVFQKKDFEYLLT